MTDEPDAFERGMAKAVEREEALLACIAELYGLGLGPDEIARELHVGVGLVLDVLRPRRSP